MGRKIYQLILLSFFVSTLQAGNIDLQTARQVASGFIQTHISIPDISLCPSTNDLTISQEGTEAVFIINLSPKGFIIISANDAAPPVLGYSLESNYSATEQPENFSEWLNGYVRMESYLTVQNIQSTQENTNLWNTFLSNSATKSTSQTTTVGPLLTSMWNQSYPYNYLCPVDPTGSGGHVYSGCVATAMAQIMYYWRYPQQGTGSHGYTWNPYGYLFADFGNTTYNWDQMVTGTNSQNFEMAQLQSHLGISVNMMYSGSGSGAYSTDAAEALKNYFGYDQSLELVYEDNYNYEDWKSLLRSQIDAGQPMYYHGFGTGGHAFNVDGYQDTMYFHFNWGWGGSYNGYFHLFNLNPGGNSFTEGQGAIINFIPAGNNVVQCGSTDTLFMFNGTMEDGSGPVAPYFNNSACSWLILPGDTLESIKLTFDRFSLEDGKDFLYVYDGTGSDASLIGSYTGNQIPPVITATSGSMYVQFVTDGSGTSNGWLASYTAKLAPFCYTNVTNLTAKSGSLSDGSGSFNYRDKTICRYKLLPEDAKSISITFNEFNTAGEGDFLEFYDLDTQDLLYRFYGQTNPGTLNFNTGKLYMVFATDQQNNATGWDFSYTSSELTGIDASEAGLSAIVFPNPAQNLLRINIEKQQTDFNLRLISADGVVVYTEDVYSGNRIQRNLDVSSYQRGIYILQISSESGIINRKIVLN